MYNHTKPANRIITYAKNHCNIVKSVHYDPTFRDENSSVATLYIILGIFGG